jgi:hypothetical protein
MMFKVKQKVFFHCAWEGQQCSEAKKTIFGRRYGLPDFTFLFVVELGTCEQNLRFTKVVEGCPNFFSSTKGYAEIEIQRPFFANIKGIDANIIFKIQTVKTWCLGSLIHGNFPRNKIPKSQGDTTRAAVSFDSSFSLASFTFRAPHERKFGKGQDELLALLALFYKSRTTKECPLEIQESWLFSS